MTRIRLAHIDHDRLLREALATCLSGQSDFEVIWTTDSLKDASRLLAEAEPDALLVDIDLHLRNACGMLREIASSNHHTKVIVLTHNSSEALISRVMSLNVKGYINKDDSLENLVAGIRRVVQGGEYFSERIGRRLRIDPAAGNDVAAADDRLSTLTLHQLQIVGRMANGESAKEIAKQMHLSVKAINSHKYRIMRRLGIHDRVQLARFAIREGLISP